MITRSSSFAHRRDYTQRTLPAKNLNLKPREFKLLEYLMRHANQVVTRTMLLENVWDYSFDPQTTVVDVHVSRPTPASSVRC